MQNIYKKNNTKKSINPTKLLQNIKLIIWDLDDTLWKGEILKKNVELNKNNIELVKQLKNNNIKLGICSKNNEKETIEFLKTNNLIQYFDNININWENKGIRIKEILEIFNIKPKDSLFIDDDINNLEDAIYHNKNINVAKPEFIELIEEYYL